MKARDFGDVGWGLANSGYNAPPEAQDVRRFLDALRGAFPDQGSEVVRGVESWLAAARFRRAFDAKLSRLGLNLNQWLVLEGTRQVIEEQGDATSQMQVADRLEMTEMTLSRVMRVLAERGLVDRRDCFMSPSLRVWVTKRGADLLESARAALMAASATESRGAAE